MPNLRGNRALSLLLLRIYFATTAIAATAASATCWYPDGKAKSNNDVPCSSTDVSACCAANALCLTNGYCLNGGMFLARGSCTDKSWLDSRCPQDCKDTAANQGIGVFACSYGNNNKFACGDVSNCSSSSSGKTFSLPGFDYILRDYQATNIGLASAITFNVASSATTTLVSTASASATIDSGASTITSVFTGTSTATGNSTGSCTPASSDQQAQYNDLVASSHTESMAIGAGVGIPLALLFLTFLALFVIEKKKNQRLVQDYRMAPSQDEKPADDMGSWGAGGIPGQPQGWAVGSGPQRTFNELHNEARIPVPHELGNSPATVRRY